MVQAQIQIRFLIRRPLSREHVRGDLNLVIMKVLEQNYGI